MNRRFDNDEIPEKLVSFINVDEDGNMFIDYMIWGKDQSEEDKKKLKKYKKKRGKEYIK